RGAAVPSGPQFAHDQDLVGTPDLIVDAQRLADSWVIYDQNLPSTLCSVQEGGVTPGVRRVLRFTVTTPNIGNADVFIGDPLEHVANNDGLFEFASCHNHFHFRHYATYELLDANTGKVWRAAKHGFCMIDVTPWQSDGGVGSWVYRICGTKTTHGTKESASGMQTRTSSGSAASTSCWMGATAKTTFRRVTTSSGSRWTRRSPRPRATSVPTSTQQGPATCCSRATTTTTSPSCASPSP